MIYTANGERIALRSFIVLFILLQIVVSFHHNLNWDEYYFLSHIYAFADGRLSEPLQTFHVELLRWLTWIPGSEADQLVDGRLFMMLCELGSLLCLYRLTCEFTSSDMALFAVAAWCGAGYALFHGASFRADPFAGFFMMASLVILMRTSCSWKQAAGAGLLGALGLLVTMKSVLFLPAFVGAFIWRWDREVADANKVVLLHFIIATSVLLGGLVLLWAFHVNNLIKPDTTAVPGNVDPSLSTYFDILDKVVLSQSVFPRSPYILFWLTQSSLSVILCGLGLWSATKHKRTMSTVALLATPLVSLIFYRNAFPYFFPFIMLPVATSAGLGTRCISRSIFRLMILFVMGLSLLMRFGVGWNEDQSSQREIAEVAHMVFPEPVPYIDRNGMLPSFPKAGFFMSSWGVERYFASRTETLTQTIERKQPPLLILNSPFLTQAVMPQLQLGVQALFAGDVATLRNNYIQHWGPIWVAGKRLPADATGFDILIGGTYTLECDGQRQIDRVMVACNAAVSLAQGAHRWAGGAATLRWGDHLPIPEESPPMKPIYYMFWRAGSAGAK